MSICKVKLNYFLHILNDLHDSYMHVICCRTENRKRAYNGEIIANLKSDLFIIKSHFCFEHNCVR